MLRVGLTSVTMAINSCLKWWHVILSPRVKVCGKQQPVCLFVYHYSLSQLLCMCVEYNILV